MQHYDVAIIGGGIGGLMSAYELATKAPGAKVVLFEKGHDIEKRACPIVTGKAPTCIKCPSCAIMEGLAGAGAFSDGKYVISTEYGGWLPNYLGPETTIDYIERLDRILVSYGAHENIYMPSDEIKLECLKYDLRLLQARVKHLGTDGNFKTMSRLIADLATKVDIFTNEDVTDIDEVKRVVHSDKDEYT